MNTLRKVGAGFLLALLISFMLTCGAELSRSETTDDLPRVVRELIEQQNPNAVIAGTILDAAIGADKDGREGTVLRIHPIGTYTLFDTTVVFCGDHSDEISAADGRVLPGDLVFVYRRQAARLIDGVPCYELKSVHQIVTDKKRFK